MKLQFYSTGAGSASDDFFSVLAQKAPKEAADATHWQAWGSWSGEAGLTGSRLFEPQAFLERVCVNLCPGLPNFFVPSSFRAFVIALCPLLFSTLLSTVCRLPVFSCLLTLRSLRALREIRNPACPPSLWRACPQSVCRACQPWAGRSCQIFLKTQKRRPEQLPPLLETRKAYNHGRPLRLSCSVIQTHF